MSVDLIGNYLMSALPFIMVALLGVIAVLAVRADSGGQTPPSLSKRMARLEDRVGVPGSRKPR
jgi:hypothetical protein